MNRIAEFYESNHLLILIVLIIVFGIYIKYTKHRNRYIVSSENKTVEEEEIEDNKITTWSTIELKYILTSEVVNFRISENQSNKYKNKLEIRRLHYKNPLAVSLLEKTTGDIIKYKINELDENYIYVEVLNVNNNLFTDEEIAMYGNNDLKSEEVHKKTQSTEKLVIMESTSEIERSNRFFIRRNRLGENIIVEFKDVHGVIWQYNHDLVYGKLKNRYDTMPCFIKYNCYTSSDTVPTYVQELDCVKIII